MKIVIGSTLSNPYISQLSKSLSAHREVDTADHGLHKFWQPTTDTDVLHIQWPEALCSWEDPQPQEMERVVSVLDEWSSIASVVTTVHNYEPHRIENYQRLYRSVYESSDGIIHLGETSRDWFFSHYDFASEKEHAVILHGNYSCFPDHVTSQEARKRLGLRADDYVCLAFGALRYADELELLLEAFGQLSIESKQLVIAGRLPTRSRLTFRYWRRYCRLYFNPRIHLREDWIPEEEVQYYLQAADALIIPREGELNSGNVALGFTFGCPVVGPDEGVIGEVLGKTGNPVYRPGDAYDLSKKIKAAREGRKELRNNNKKYAKNKMKWTEVSKRHIKTYKKIA